MDPKPTVLLSIERRFPQRTSQATSRRSRDPLYPEDSFVSPFPVLFGSRSHSFAFQRFHPRDWKPRVRNRGGNHSAVLPHASLSGQHNFRDLSLSACLLEVLPEDAEGPKFSR